MSQTKPKVELPRCPKCGEVVVVIKKGVLIQHAFARDSTRAEVGAHLVFEGDTIREGLPPAAQFIFHSEVCTGKPPPKSPAPKPEPERPKPSQPTVRTTPRGGRAA